jgi:hypothetical protein
MQPEPHPPSRPAARVIVAFGGRRHPQTHQPGVTTAAQARATEEAERDLGAAGEHRPLSGCCTHLPITRRLPHSQG